VAYGTVARFAATLPGPPRVVNLEPSSLADIFQDIRNVGAVLGVPERAEALVTALLARVDAIRERAPNAPRRRCVVLEWIDPLFCSGHWVPELVEIAGGLEPVGRRGADSTEIDWDEVVAAAPEVLVVSCCGYSVERTLEDLTILRSSSGFSALPAAQSGEIWVVDGSAYFSRPGPRIVDSLEILGEILHPGRFGGGYRERRFARVG
jgi:iron complex transport system substrate-binding protein